MKWWVPRNSNSLSLGYEPSAYTRLKLETRETEEGECNQIIITGYTLMNLYLIGKSITTPLVHPR